MATATRKILNTGSNKYQSAVRQMQRSIYTDNIYVSLHANTITTDVKNDLENLNEAWMTSCFMQKVIRDNYRLCFPRTNWSKSSVYDKYNPQKDPQTQNSFIFDSSIGNGVLFLCVGNNKFNRSDISTASTVKPSAGYSSVANLPTEVIEQDDGYSWIALGQSDLRFTDSNWITLEIRDGLSFFGGDQGSFVDDGVTLADFKTAISSPYNPGDTGAAGFYPLNNTYNQTNASEIDSGDALYTVANMERFDAFTFQQALKLQGSDTQIQFSTTGTAGSTLSLPASIIPTSLYEQINNSPFTTSSSVGWYNDKINGWASKEGSVEMITLDTTGITSSAFVVTGVAAPSIAVKGNGTSPTAEFILSRINENTWDIRGVKISKDIATNSRLVGKNNTHVEFVVSNTAHNEEFEDGLRAFITPYGGLLLEENLYGPIIPVNSFMMNVTINESNITNTLKEATVPSPTTFDSYSLFVNPLGYTKGNATYKRELGQDLPPNKTEYLDNLVSSTFDPVSGGPTIVAGNRIYKALPTISGSSARGELIGVVQSVEATQLTDADITFSTTQTDYFGMGVGVFIGTGAGVKAYTQTATSKIQDTVPLSGTLTHIGNSSLDISGGSEKRITIKYITRV